MTTEQLYDIYLQHPIVTTDSRNCPEGSIFFALKGESFNGNRFALAALEKGCAYAVVDEVCDSAEGQEYEDRIILVDDVLHTLQQLARMHRDHFSGPVIQITGTNGKTTTKELIAAVLSQRYHVLYTQGNLNNHIGVPLTLLCLTADHDIAVIETGANHPGEIKALAEIVNPDCGLITNVGMAHIEGFGSFEGVIRTKGELYDYLRSKEKVSDFKFQVSGSQSQISNLPFPFVFLHADNPHLGKITQGLAAITYGSPASSPAVTGEVVECAPFLKLRWYVKAEAPTPSLQGTSPQAGTPTPSPQAVLPLWQGESLQAVGQGATESDYPGSPSKLEGVADACVGRGSVSMDTTQIHSRIKNIALFKLFRRNLRSNSTSAEAALWTIIKNRQIGGLKFRRQFSVSRYIIDFFCPELQLAIELDGDYHTQSAVDAHDYERDKFLEEELGITTLRFENRIVFEQPEVIVHSILEAKDRVECGYLHTSSLPQAGTPTPSLQGTSPQAGAPTPSPQAVLPLWQGESLQAVGQGATESDYPGSPSKLEGVADACVGRGSVLSPSLHTSSPQAVGQGATESAYLSHTVQTHLIGAYNVDNALAAVSVGLCFGVKPEQIDKALEAYEPHNNRSEMRKTKSNTLIIDAYNANPSSMGAALSNFATMPAPEGMQKMLILGDMKELGAVSEQEHSKVVEKIKEMVQPQPQTSKPQSQISNFKFQTSNLTPQSVWLVGPNFKSLNPPFPTFNDVEEVKEHLRQHPVEGKLILIKGSNSTHLYQLPDNL